MAFASALRVTGMTLLVCAVAYPLTILLAATALVPEKAKGQLLRDGAGRVVGSRQVAQKFEAQHYLWPRPSAADYNGAAASGSNLATGNPALRERAEAEIARHGAGPARPLPAELATASGAGLDPHLSLAAALWQAPRVAAARGVPVDAVRGVIVGQARAVPLLAPAPIVNVLETNLALDAAFPLEAGGG